MAQWNRVPLIDYIELIGGGTPKTTVPEYWNGNIPWLSVKDFNNDKRYVYSTEKHISQSGFENSPTKMLHKDDIIISARGTVGEIAMIPFDMAFNQSCYGIRASRGIDQPFLYYLLKNCISQLKRMTHGSVFDTITRDTFANIEVDIPDAETQKRISSVLADIDNKIEVNDAINDNLQQQARAIYKEWFIDFGQTSGTTPATWKHGKLKDVLQLHKRAIKAGANTTLPYLPIDTIPMQSFGVTEFRPNDEAKSSLITFQKDDIIVGAMRVYFHRVVLAPCDGITRTTCFTLSPYNSKYLSYALLTCDLDSSIDHAQNTSKGSTMPYAVWDGGMGEIEIVIPPTDVAEEFNNIVLPMLRQIQRNCEEIKLLGSLRDTLLPKLMSGEIDVSGIQL